VGKRRDQGAAARGPGFSRTGYQPMTSQLHRGYRGGVASPFRRRWPRHRLDLRRAPGAAAGPRNPEGRMDNGAHVVLRVARIIAASLPAGVAAFWAVAWVLTNGGAAPYSPEAIDAALAFRIWAVVALAGFAGALYFRGRALAVVESVGRDDRAALVGHAGAVQ